MDSFSTEDLSKLVDHSGGWFLSLYMPTERTGREVQQNRIRFKNLLDEARASIRSVKKSSDGNGAVDAIELQLDELQKMEADDNWWQHQSDGLALFLDGKNVRRWRISQKVPQLYVCSRKFHVRPLCRLLQNDGRFYLLAVSQNDVRFFLGTKTSVSELNAAELPNNLRSALNIDEYISSLQHHSTARDGGKAMFHGHGGSDPDVVKQDEIKQYFHRIDDALKSYFGVERAPLVFVGVDYLFPIFQEVCDYQSLVDEPVRGNPDELSAEQLHEQAWPLVEKLFDAQRSKLLEQFGTAVSSQRGSDDIDVVLTAAKQGQVATLLTACGEHVWSRAADNDPTGQTGSSADEDLVNAAVVATLRNGGEVYSVQDARLERSLAAIFRYPISQENIN